MSTLVRDWEGLIKDDTKVTDVCRSRNRGAIDAEGEVGVGFIAVEFEQVGLHPGFYICEAVADGGVGGGCDGFGGDINSVGQVTEN